MRFHQADCAANTRFAIGFSAHSVLWVLFAVVPGVTAAEPPRLRVSDNDRFLVTEDGSPFFWLGDTTWSLVRQSVREATDDQPEVERYFKKRKEQGFNVVQTSLLTIPVRGLIDDPNVYGHPPFIDGDFAKPRVVPGPANDYWDHFDYLVDLAAKYDMYMAVVIRWVEESRRRSSCTTNRGWTST